jgi:small subunit ribosomal protein S9
MEVINAVGRRKSAIARVYLSQGTGNVTVNDKDFKEYFPTGTLQYIVLQPFGVLSLDGKFDVKVNIEGGGVKGQAEAVRLGITRALIKVDEENRKALKSAGFVTRDPREVERKKPGQKKARKRFQFSKR